MYVCTRGYNRDNFISEKFEIIVNLFINGKIGSNDNFVVSTVS